MKLIAIHNNIITTNQQQKYTIEAPLTGENFKPENLWWTKVHNSSENFKPETFNEWKNYTK